MAEKVGFHFNKEWGGKCQPRITAKNCPTTETYQDYLIYLVAGKSNHFLYGICHLKVIGQDKPSLKGSEPPDPSRGR